MNKKFSLALIMVGLIFSSNALQATSVLDILNEEANQPIVEKTNQLPQEETTVESETIPSTPTTESSTKKTIKEQPKAIKPTEEKTEIITKEPESFVMNFTTNKSCSYLNKEIKKNSQATIGAIENKTLNFQPSLFSNVQEQDEISAFLKDSLITFKDKENNVLSQMQISNQLSNAKIYIQDKKLFILGNLENKIALLVVNIANITTPTIHHFSLLNGVLEDAQFNEDSITFLTKLDIDTTNGLETYEAHIENGKIKILKRDFECNEAYYLAPDNASSKNLWNKMSLYSITKINTKDYSTKQKKLIWSNLKISLQKDHFLAYAFVKEDNPLLCNSNIQCTLENEHDYTLLQRFDFQKTWPTHLIPWHIIALSENKDKLQIISTSHYLSLDKNFKIIEKHIFPTEISKAFFVWETAIGANDKIIYYIYKNKLLSSEIGIEDWKILNNNDVSFTLVNENWLKYFIFNESWITIKRNVDFEHTQINSENMVFDSSKNMLHLPMLIWEEKPSEICNYEKVKIDWEIQEKENCHTENVIKQSFSWVKTFKIPNFRVLDEQKSENKLDEVFVGKTWTLFE